jgi:effector-binding domain-containing protein
MDTLMIRQWQQRIASICICASLCIPIFICNAAFAQKSEHPPTIGKLVIQTIPAKHYLQGGFETDFQSMGEPVAKTLTELMEAASENKVGLHGPVVHYYYGAPHRDPEKRFKMETGFFVPAEAPVVGPFKPRELPAFKCATIVYIGPATSIGDAWQDLYRSVRDQQLKPTAEERELYLYWEGVDSPNNVVQVQLGVE